MFLIIEVLLSLMSLIQGSHSKEEYTSNYLEFYLLGATKERIKMIDKTQTLSYEIVLDMFN